MDTVHFTVNGEPYSVSGSEVSAGTSLQQWLRARAQLTGTKAMCRQGGCGACVVSAARAHPATGERQRLAVNSCLMHVLSAHEWDITTVEGVGGGGGGEVAPHVTQRRLVEHNGTQCGYCSPGWVCAMYSLYESGAKLTAEQLEREFGGHLCRCTGYRPILDAIKTFASDHVPDLEDLHKLRCLNIDNTKSDECHSEQGPDLGEWCVLERGAHTASSPPPPLQLVLAPAPEKSRWYKAYTIKDIFQILAKNGTNSYRFVAGNTGIGVYPEAQAPRALVDISSVAALRGAAQDENLCVGAGCSLAEAQAQLVAWSERPEFRYVRALADHLDLVAHTAVRNIGTLGGNLALKRQHPEFPSDVYLLLDTVGAAVTIVDSSLKEKNLSMEEFLKEDLTNKLITTVKLPPLSSSHQIRTYKVMPRAQNALAIVNAGFLFNLDSTNKVLSANIAFGAMSGSFRRAAGAERALAGRALFADDTLRAALRALAAELRPARSPPDAAPECRKAVALALFYRAVLSLCPPAQLPARAASGAAPLARGASRGQQAFPTDAALWPLTQPVAKLEALAQVTGEARYAGDAPAGARAAHAALALADRACADILHVDATEALKLPGVLACLTAKDIPGENSFTPLAVPWQQQAEEVLAGGRARYAGQPLALLVAATQELALRAASLVKVEYGPAATPVLDIEAALAAPDRDKRVREEVNTAASERGGDVQHVVRGRFAVGAQYHLTLETQTCWAAPAGAAGGGLRLRCATQWPDLVHVAVASALRMQQNQIEVEVERVGGGYGGKATRSALVACACALAARVLRRPVLLELPLQHNMRALGMRHPAHFRYEAGVDAAGVIQYLDLSYYSDCGWSFNDTPAGEVAGAAAALYDSRRWSVRGYSVLTDKASNTWCRAPATTEGTAIMEHIMEHIAYTVKRDPVEVKLQHFRAEHGVARELVATLRRDCEYDARMKAIEDYNRANAWKKRALAMSVMAYPIAFSGNYAVTISVYHADGTVIAAHGGVEMGQGINTKLAQVIAHMLGVPLSFVAVRGTDSFAAPNAMASNGSITSDSVAHAALRACALLLQRLPPAAAAAGPARAWRDRVKRAYDNGVNLQASYMMSAQADALGAYHVCGACALEAELDALTGQRELRRADLLEDAGRSVSPLVDVGQIEGAFVMGLGLWTMEALQYSPATGRLLTADTWGYAAPGARDVPADMRVALRPPAPAAPPAPRAPAGTGVLRSKATGEPALVLAVAAALALRRAARAAAAEYGHADQWLDIDIPYNIENILKAVSPNIDSFTLK